MEIVKQNIILLMCTSLSFLQDNKNKGKLCLGILKVMLL